MSASDLMATRAGRGFDGLRVLAFESRRASDMRRLIEKHGGDPLVVPAMREVPRESNHAALTFAKDLDVGAFTLVIFLTGVGARALASIIEPVMSAERLVAALARTTVVARGPKPTAALREVGVTTVVPVPPPHTWREVLHTVDAMANRVPIGHRRVAVQEYGVSNQDLLAGLRDRGADVTPVSVYEWALPEDTSELGEAVMAIVRQELDVLLFTTSAQVHHLIEIARRLDVVADLRRACASLVVASIGPTTTETLLDYDLPCDLEPSRPNMGLLVLETANRSSFTLSCAPLRRRAIRA